MKIASYLFLFLSFLASLTAQRGTHIRVDFTQRLQTEGSVRIIHESGEEPHISYFVQATPSDMAQLQWRFATDGEWHSVPIDPHVSYEDRHFSILQFSRQGSSDTLYMRTTGPLADSVYYHRYYPGPRPAPDTAVVDLRDGDCDCPEPDIQRRMDWCTNCPTTSTPVQHEPTHLIVHHSAGPNSSSDWSAVVRSIWDFHVNGRGWADIGYHYLIDPLGNIYTGRADNIQGAHFCSRNRGALGMCMLGTYTSELPTAAARDAWMSLAAFAACKWEVDPMTRTVHSSSGLNLWGVSGHRAGCATECPGQLLYDQLPVWRAELAATLDECQLVEDSLLLVASQTAFPFTVDLAWSGGNPSNTAYRLFVRPVNAGPLSGWIENFPGDVLQYRLGLEAQTEYEFQLEGWSDGNLNQVSNSVLWSTSGGDTVASSAQLTPNPIGRGGEVQLTWTASYKGEFELEWIDMAGKKYPIGDRRKTRDTYLELLSCPRLAAGQYFLHLTYNGKTINLPLIVY